MTLAIKNLTIGAGQPKICVSLTAATNDGLIEQATEAYQSAAEIIEWRVDFFEGLTDQERVLETLSHIRTALKEKVLLFTFRTKEEGGQKELSLADYRVLYETVADSGLVEIADVELVRAEYLGRGFLKKIKEADVKLLMSSHDFQRTPVDGELVMRVGVMKQLGADIGKIALMPHSRKDVLRLMGLSDKLKGLTDDLPLVLISMGELGKLSRIGSEWMDSVLTFGSLAGESSAPGQIPVAHLAEILAVLHVANDGSERNE